MISFNKVREAEENSADVAASYLRGRGWSYSSDNPASTWLWQKALPDGRIIMVDRDTAVSLQSRADSISLSFWPKPDVIKVAA